MAVSLQSCLYVFLIVVVVVAVAATSAAAAAAVPHERFLDHGRDEVH